MALSPDERAELRSTARSLLGRASSSERVRHAIMTEAGFDAGLWAQMVELGWTTIHVPERFGGAGCGYADLEVVLHELGRALTPSPFLASAVLATGALLAADNDAVAGPVLAEIVGGEKIGTVAFASDRGSYDATQRSVTWVPKGPELALDGTAGFVLDADVAGALVVVAQGADGRDAVMLVDAREVGVQQIRRMSTVDLTRRVFSVCFDGVRIPADRMLSEPGDAARELVEQLLALGVVGVAIDAVGTTEQALETTAAYARDRVQFGKPIGSFQAVKHHCANMAVAVEASRAATGAAATQLDEDVVPRRITAGVTASYVGPACSEACALAMRVHGGIGFTWEHDTHLWMKRVKLDEVLFGSPAWHRRRLADDVSPAIVPT